MVSRSAAWLFPMLLCAALALDCGGYKPPALGACGDGTPLAEEPCSAGGFIANKRCFASQLAACGCLSCPRERCMVSESEPAKVTCRPE